MPNITVKVYIEDDVDERIKPHIMELLQGADYDIVTDTKIADYTFSKRSQMPRSSKYEIGEIGNAVFEGNMHITNQEIRSTTNKAQKQISKSPLSEEEKQELAELFRMLETALQRETRQGDAKKAKQAAEKMSEISKDINQSEPKWYQAKVKVEDLIEAAKNLGVVVPYALPIVEQILAFVSRYAK